MAVDAYLRMFRPGDVLVGILAILLSSLAAVGPGITDHWDDVIITAVAVALYVCGGNTLNDSTDARVDSIAHPDRPVASGIIDPGMAKILGLAMMLVAAIIATVFLSLACAAIVIAACILLALYEGLLKDQGPIGNVSIAIITMMSVLLGGLCVGSPVEVMWLTAAVFCVTLGREIYKDMADLHGDILERKTLPMRVGFEFAGVMAFAFYVVSCVIFLAQSFGNILYALTVIPLILAIYAGVKGWEGPDKADKFGKICLLLLMLIAAGGAFY